MSTAKKNDLGHTVTIRDRECDLKKKKVKVTRGWT